jgi:hypothetical protein
MIASGGLSGGLYSAIAGGNFWSGVREGLITSGLNHAMHIYVKKVQVKKALRDRFKNSTIDPDGKPVYTLEYLQKVLNGGIEGLKEAWVKGGKPNMKWENLGADGKTEAVGDLTLFGKHIYNNYKLVTAMFHEFRHAWQYKSGTYVNWKEKYGEYTADLMKEYDAYNFEMIMGNFDGSVWGQRDIYRDAFFNDIKNKGGKITYLN